MPNVTTELYASHLSKLVFAWMEPLIRKGWKNQLNPSMLWSLQFKNRWVRQSGDNSLPPHCQKVMSKGALG